MLSYTNTNGSLAILFVNFLIIDDEIWRQESSHQLHAAADFGYNKLGYDKNSRLTKHRQDPAATTKHPNGKPSGSGSGIPQRGFSQLRYHNPAAVTKLRADSPTKSRVSPARGHEVNNSEAARSQPGTQYPLDTISVGCTYLF